RVGERGDMTACFPNLRSHEDRGVEPDDVVAELHHRTPPGVLHIALEQDTERSVIPRGAESAVDVGRGKHQAATLREVYDALHRFGIAGRCHREARLVRGPAFTPAQR